MAKKLKSQKYIYLSPRYDVDGNVNVGRQWTSDEHLDKRNIKYVRHDLFEEMASRLFHMENSYNRKDNKLEDFAHAIQDASSFEECQKLASKLLKRDYYSRLRVNRYAPGTRIEVYYDDSNL